MKTTLQLPDGLYRSLKVTAASEGRTLTELIQECLKKGLALMRSTSKRKHAPYRLPVIRSKRPGALNLTSEMMDALLWDDPAGVKRR
ncbi:MAG: hypothetical protein A3G34_02870 [Candidatus Lindowbacteria bacterium RIFCSPLOWO2_12_FULL_62_27]|nr:MAG: hypothetical protein A3G34_02870 [Candidatus Lindowbacteria bacterium RIFCSPLOWO2_12_FULL_62_27]OGH64032.1 MAG: hypothetical protein A3I06_01640 [Candidatus Lindowbacteria bacterium RIFCSPLOWO2_02_FULL_62_12]